MDQSGRPRQNRIVSGLSISGGVTGVCFETTFCEESICRVIKPKHRQDYPYHLAIGGNLAQRVHQFLAQP